MANRMDATGQSCLLFVQKITGKFKTFSKILAIFFSEIPIGVPLFAIWNIRIGRLFHLIARARVPLNCTAPYVFERVT